MTSAYRSTLAKLVKILPERVTLDELAKGISQAEAEYIAANWTTLSNVELIWREMDRVWDTTQAGYEPSEASKLSEFYSSPVWLLNGVFVATDPESIEHRRILCDFVTSIAPTTVVEFGGGFGSLSRNLAAQRPTAQIQVVEPFVSKLALTLASEIPNLNYCKDLPKGADIVIAQDVLEHVTDPLGEFATLLAAVPIGGLIITANCFKPVIKCHYPGAYHLDHSFEYIAPLMGCRLERKLKGAEHIEVYRKTSKRVNMRSVKLLEKASRLAEPALNKIVSLRRRNSPAS